MTDFKISLAAARVNAGLTQNELAEKIGVTRASVISWEKGKSVPRKSALYMLADVCGIPIENISMPSSIPEVSKVK